MSEHALPVRPKMGDEVTVAYRSSRTDGVVERSGTLAREAAGEAPPTMAHDEGGTYRHYLVREAADAYLVATVNPDGQGGGVYSLSFEEGDAPDITAWTTGDGPSTWRVRWANGEKTARVRLGTLTRLTLRAVG